MAVEGTGSGDTGSGDMGTVSAAQVLLTTGSGSMSGRGGLPTLSPSVSVPRTSSISKSNNDYPLELRVFLVLEYWCVGEGAGA